MRLRFWLTLVAMPLALSVCVSTSGHPIDFAQVDQLVPASSTLADAKKILGEPTGESAIADGSGSKMYLWSFATGGAGGIKSKAVFILFDGEGKMIRIVSRGQNQAR